MSPGYCKALENSMEMKDKCTAESKEKTVGLGSYMVTFQHMPSFVF